MIGVAVYLAAVVMSGEAAKHIDAWRTPRRHPDGCAADGLSLVGCSGPPVRL